jgi:hypothetical protein
MTRDIFLKPGLDEGCTISRSAWRLQGQSLVAGLRRGVKLRRSRREAGGLPLIVVS